MGLSQGFRGPEPLCVEARLPRTTQGLRNAHTKGFRRLNTVHYTDITGGQKDAEYPTRKCIRRLANMSKVSKEIRANRDLTFNNTRQ